MQVTNSTEVDFLVARVIPEEAWFVLPIRAMGDRRILTARSFIKKHWQAEPASFCARGFPSAAKAARLARLNRSAKGAAHPKALATAM